jgi:hypothetical protein
VSEDEATSATGAEGVDEAAARPNAEGGGEAAAASSSAADGDEPRRKKKKKKRADAPQEPAQDEAPRRDVPGFAEAYPRHPELDRLLDAFERGDYAAVRAGAPRLAESAKDEDVRRAARELRLRIDPDPLAAWLLLVAAALLVFLAGWYWRHPKHDSSTAKPPAHALPR